MTKIIKTILAATLALSTSLPAMAQDDMATVKSNFMQSVLLKKSEATEGMSQADWKLYWIVIMAAHNDLCSKQSPGLRARISKAAAKAHEQDPGKLDAMTKRVSTRLLELGSRDWCEGADKVVALFEKVTEEKK